MTKHEFISALRAKLSNLPKKDAEERLLFYEEMIDDRIEDGLSEIDAISDIGTIEEIYSQIVKEVPLYRIIGEKIKQKRPCGGGKIAIIISTSIIWFPIMIAMFAVAISLFASLWSVAAVLWSVFASLAAAVLAGAVMGILNILGGNLVLGLLLISAGTVSLGLCIFSFYGSKYSTKGLAILTKKTAIGIKNIMLR